MSAFQQQLLDAAMLIPQVDFQVQHPLADAIEPEMAGFDHAGMHRPDGDLVNLLAFDGIIVVIAGDVLTVIVAENIRQTAFVGVIADHLQPGMAFGPDAELFGDFTFEHVKRLTFGGQGRVRFRCPAAGQQQVLGRAGPPAG